MSTEGSLWKNQRHFCTHLLRDLRVGKNVMQQKILSELNSMMTEIDARINNEEEEVGGVDLPAMIDFFVGSIIHSIVFGESLKPEEFARLKGLVNAHLNNVGRLAMGPLIWKPKIFKRLPYFGGVWSEFEKTGRELFQYFGDKLAEERNSAQGISQTECLVGAFLREKHKRDVDGGEEEREGGQQHFYT